MTYSINQLSAITHEFVINKMADGVFNSNALGALLYSKRIKLDGGSKIGAPVSTTAIDSTTGGFFTGMGSFNDTEIDQITRAEVDWKNLRQTVLIAKSDILKNSGKMQQLNLLAKKVEIAEQMMNQRIVNSIFNTVANGFDALDVIMSASVAYAGLDVDAWVDEAGADGWAAYVNNGSSVDRALSLPLIQTVQGNITEGKYMPDVAVSRQNVYDELIGLLSPHQRIQKSESLSELGHKGKLEYNGLSWIVDSHAPAGSIYFINTEFFNLYVHAAEDLTVESFPQLENEHGIKKRMHIMANTLCSNRRFQGALNFIKVAA
jgi:hypothetical protein